MAGTEIYKSKYTGPQIDGFLDKATETNELVRQMHTIHGNLEDSNLATQFAFGFSYYEREALPTPNRTNITIHPTAVLINGNIYCSLIDVTLDTASVKQAGTDVYIYACIGTGNTLDFVLSRNSTVPSGYNANNSRKIGGFHCLCAAVGTISGHTLSGYNAGDILPLSVWDLKHRPQSDPEGMVWVSGIGMWVDIYLASWNGSRLVSTFGGTCADGESSRKYHGLKFSEDFGLIGKRQPLYDEFIVFAKGSNECTNISGGADVGTTGGHKDTANRRMISNYGIEDCCGFMWQWTNDMLEDYPGSKWTSTNAYLENYAWQAKSVYDSTVDSQKYGEAYGLLRRLLVGGSWGHAARCGSRCAHASNFGSYVNANIGGRGLSVPRIIER